MQGQPWVCRILSPNGPALIEKYVNRHQVQVNTKRCDATASLVHVSLRFSMFLCFWRLFSPRQSNLLALLTMEHAHTWVIGYVAATKRSKLKRRSGVLAGELAQNQKKRKFPIKTPYHIYHQMDVR